MTNTIAAVSPQGGVGKTALTFLIGNLLASHLKLRALAIDANPDHAAPAATVRVARNVVVRQLASGPVRLRSARWLPYDPQLVRAATASARLVRSREREHAAVLRAGALPFSRTAVRLARETLGR
jgi:hypothetical protein